MGKAQHSSQWQRVPTLLPKGQQSLNPCFLSFWLWGKQRPPVLGTAEWGDSADLWHFLSTHLPQFLPGFSTAPPNRFAASVCIHILFIFLL